VNGPPEKENPRFAAEGSKNEDFRLTITPLGLELQARLKCEDQWICNYLLHLEILNAQFGDGPASSHIVHAAKASYYKFCVTCCPDHRKQAWTVIQAACRLFSRRSRLN
jgi:hypothetical protein